MTPAAKRRADAAQAKKAQNQARKGQISEIGKKRSAMEQAKLADSMKRFNYLLGQTELFQHFVDLKVSRKPPPLSLPQRSAGKLTRILAPT
jgi:SWI/SNF-related matrix-associated actin-dependent regulator of chromatin subfamily A member 5